MAVLHIAEVLPFFQNVYKKSAHFFFDGN